MRKILLASHGTLADSMLCSIEMIMGRQERIKTMCAYLNGENEIESRVEKFMKERSAEDEWIVVTDLFGGSVNNEFMGYAQSGEIRLLSGMNLAMLLTLTENLDNLNGESMLQDVMSAAQEGCVDCSALVCNGQMMEDF
ncbi:PTS fructose transporter subunit IIA [bacterium 1XD8-76]|nr:PTS fructose transporter subunit IIA [bacterium 1XD8-76]